MWPVAGREQTPLDGGNVSSAVRIGAHVHRDAHDRSAYVHELLRFLAAHEFSGSPRLTGMDPDGREILQYVPGEVCHGGPAPEWMGEGAPLESVVSLVRRLHDLTAGTPLAIGGEVVCHGDIAARNIVFRDRCAVCLLDWDLAAPGLRVKDLALMARRLLNLGPGGPPPSVQGPRIRALMDAYGLDDRDCFVLRIIEYQAAMISAIARIAATGDGRYQAMVHRWGTHPDHAAAVLAWLVDHARDLQQALIT
jgi:hypothetical protein